MKILWNNYLKNSTVTATDENTLYPVSNVIHDFLLKKFQSETTGTTITITFTEDLPVSAIFYSYTNIVTSDLELFITKGADDEYFITKGATDEYFISPSSEFTLKDSTGTVVLTGVLSLDAGTTVKYFTPVTARSLEIVLKATDTLYLGGLSVGDPIEYENIQLNPRLNLGPRLTSELTDGGQMISKKQKALREWQVTIPFMTNAKRLETLQMLNSVGYDTPVFADLFDGDSTIEEPMYCAITQAGALRMDSSSGEYTMGITLQERR